MIAIQVRTCWKRGEFVRTLGVACFALPFAILGDEASAATRARSDRAQLDQNMVRETVEAVADVVGREYFDRDVALRVNESLREQLSLGQFAPVDSAENLAELLTEHLRALTSDKHLGVIHISPADETRLSTDAKQQSRQLRARRQNYGAEHIQILSGNVGYLNFTTFYRLEEAREAIEAAMASLRYADALILDMRSNRGGNPGSVALLASYLFESPEKLLFDIVPRDGETKSYYTESVPESHRDARRPVFVLTAANTFSAGEGLAFILQDLGRVEVVGEVTAGAANPGRGYPVNAYFEVLVPNSQVRSAVTGQNWEGVGVIPDIPTTEEQALEVAHRQALQRLLETTTDTIWADVLRKELQRLSPR